MEIKINTEFRDLIPPLSPEEREQLEANIVADGCRDPIILWNGVIIDGHNRYDICTKRGLQFETKILSFESREHAKIWIIDNQSGRRNISDIDRIALQKHRKPLVEKIAAAARKAKEGRPKLSAKLRSVFTCECGEQFEKEVWHCRKCNHHWSKDVATCHNCHTDKKIKTSKELAKAAGVGERTFDAGSKILDALKDGKITADIVEDVRRGRKAIHAVAKKLDETEKQEKRKAARDEAAKSSIAIREVIIGDFRKHADKVADGSLSLIFTDPPYDQKALELFDGLAKFARDKLCDGGSLICYCGHLQLPRAITALSSCLRYWWTIACVHSGRHSLMKEYGIRAGWKPVLWFVKGTRDDKSNIVSDVMSGGEEKSEHEWQQARSEAEYWIGELCPADGIVCDPFLGGGTTAVAAKALGRKWVGFEVDAGAAAKAVKRISANG